MLKTESKKYCPLLSTTAEDSLVTCQADHCAWYVPQVHSPTGRPLSEGRCAIQSLGAIPELSKEVMRL